MKKYFISMVDFSEIINLTTDEGIKTRAQERMNELGVFNEKGKPDAAFLKTFTASVSEPFFAKLERRLNRRRGGIGAVHSLMGEMLGKKEYQAMFLFLVIEYGFLEWQVPEIITLLPASSDALKAFMTQFMAGFDSFMEAMRNPEIPPAEDDAE